jgi:integrase
LLKLKRDQVDLDARTININGDEMKNDDKLSIPISRPALEVLQRVMKENRVKSPYIFCNANGKPYTQMQVRRPFIQALKQAGIEDFRWHDFRHCFATWNREAGVDLDTLADLMGQKDTRMTRRYAHITPEHFSKAVQLLELSYEKISTKLAQCENEKGSQKLQPLDNIGGPTGI